MIRRVLRRLKYRFWFVYFQNDDEIEVYLIKRWPPITSRPRVPRIANATVDGPYTREQADLKWAKIEEYD